MAESILSGILQKVLVQLASLAVKEFSLAWGLEDDLKKLRRTLTSISAVLSDAEEQRYTNYKISLWLRRLQGVLYDAEDVLADFSYEAARRKVISSRGGIIQKVGHYSSSSNPVAYRLRIGHKIKEIRNRLKEIKTDKNEFNLNERVDQGRLRLRERDLTNSVVDSEVIGRYGDQEKIVKLLKDSGGHDVSVVPIVGIGGMGKTALAKLVYNDQRIVDHFNSKVWVCVGDMKKFDTNHVTATITAETTSRRLEDFIRDKVRGKKFLLVLDDLWDADRGKWADLKGMLSSGARGSKILVTTRDSSVARCVGTVPEHRLGGLPHEQCVSLFKKLAFASEAEVDEGLMRIGDQIVRKCKGVPLAVRTLGSHLFLKTDQHEWTSVRDSGIWQISWGEDGILAILKFSYDRLPSHLKLCFVYCSVFPEDYGFSDYELISFWMAHGLLQGPDPEYVGKQYINEFLSRGFFQDSRRFKTFWGVFKMHDLVWELARSLAKDEFQIEEAEQENVWRHVWFESRKPENLAKSDDHDYVRSVMMSRSSAEHLKAFSSKCHNLRVLWVVDSNIFELPECVGSLKYLKYLNVTRCRNLKKLPESICELYNLEALSLLMCQELEKIPKNIGDLVNLRWLAVTTKQKHLPKNGIESLTSLQFLWFHKCVNLETLFEGSRIQLKSLRTLIFTTCQNLKSMRRLSESDNKQHSLPALENLELTGSDNMVDVSEFLQMTPNLVSLEIINLGQWKTWSSPILQCAHTLRKLKIHRCANLMALPEWLPNLTSLETLDLEDCPRLEYLSLNMESLIVTQSVRIVRCGRLSESCRRGQGEEWFKISHVPNVEIV